MSKKIDMREIPGPLLAEFRRLCATWEDGNRKDVRDAVIAHRGELPWLLLFTAVFLNDLGWDEYQILGRLIEGAGHDMLG
jgi:hypothetical protein